MPYMVTYDRGNERAAIAAHTAQDALKIGQDAEADGCQNVMVDKLGADDIPLRQFEAFVRAKDKVHS